MLASGLELGWLELGSKLARVLKKHIDAWIYVCDYD